MESAVMDAPTDQAAAEAAAALEEHEDRPNGAADDYEPAEGELVIEGSGQLGFNVGGKKPTTSSLRLTGGKIEVGGSFPKGTTVSLRVTAVVGEVAFIDKTDAKTGQVVDCDRRQKARIVGVELLSD